MEIDHQMYGFSFLSMYHNCCSNWTGGEMVICFFAKMMTNHWQRRKLSTMSDNGPHQKLDNAPD